MPKGKYIRTDYHNKINSEGHKGEKHHNFGKHLSEETCKKISDAHIGLKHTEETCKKISIIQKGKKRGPHTKETCKKIGDKKIGIPRSEETCKKLSLYTGERASGYIDGRSYKKYCFKFNNKRKNAVRDFFGGYDIVSGEHQNDCLKKHPVHHVDHDRQQGCNGKPFNLVPMSAKHHAKEPHNKEEYKNYINKTLREGFKWGIWNEEEYKEKVMYD